MKTSNLSRYKRTIERMDPRRAVTFATDFSKKTWEILDDPATAQGRIRWLGLRANMKYYERFGTRRGTKFMREDWDNLLILDACRYDMFADRNWISGELQTRTSLGSQSWDFMQQNFLDQEFHDTVYITSNPYVARLPSGIFHAVIDLLDDWDSTLQTVHPKTVAKAAIRARSRFPEKRLIIHFMQPHYPFIGEQGQQIHHVGYSDEPEKTLRGNNVWGELRSNSDDVTRNDVWGAYNENLDLVLPHVKEVTDGLDGKSVVTADHGNLVGERLRPIPVRGYGHPPGIPHPALVTVPWLVIHSEKRREIQSDPPETYEKPSEDKISERLEALGYRE